MTARGTGFESFVLDLVDDLRAHDVTVTVDRVVTFVEALELVGAGGRDAVHAAGRATLVRRPEDLDTFDRAFGRWWDGATPTPHDVIETVREVAMDVDDADGDPQRDLADPVDGPVAVRWSDEEVLRHRDFSTCTPEELRAINRLMHSLQITTAPRRSRRRRPLRHGGNHVDLRRTARHALATGGEITRWRHDAPSTRPRRLIVLLDVSGSMAPYARALLQFAQVAVRARSRHRLPVEVFALGTRLTRLTRELSDHDPDRALELAGRTVPDWSGGTRLGTTIREFVDRWGAPGLARGATVVVLSDGWDRGDPEVLAEQMARLSRLAHRIVWVNPLRASPGYRPLARGMAAALPFVDRFVDGHDLAALDDLARILAA